MISDVYQRPGQAIQLKVRPLVFLVASFVATAFILALFWPTSSKSTDVERRWEGFGEELIDEPEIADVVPGMFQSPNRPRPAAAVGENSDNLARRAPNEQQVPGNNVQRNAAPIPVIDLGVKERSARGLVSGPYPPVPASLHPSHVMLDPATQGMSEKQLTDESFKKFAFNEYRSSQLPYNRDIADTRSSGCANKKYPAPSALPKATVIICFVNEAWSALFRTLWTVLERSPPELLHEVILLDDASDAVWLQDELEDEMTRLPDKVKLYRSDRRLGLIRARMLGASHAEGDILVFLDSHCEANVGWLEPLVAHIAQDRTSVVCPAIDSISARNMDYHGSAASSRGTFHWTLDFTWEFAHNDGSPSDPIKSPTMAGGLFAIDKHYFYEIGVYDRGMDGWGGENIEMSFRIWMCGGSLWIIPCSRVGHIFRDSHPYKVPNSTINETFLRNSIRVAEVWMDDYKEVFYEAHPSARSVDFGDVSDRVAFRQQMQCKSFQWYLDNITPGKFIPNQQNVRARGQVRNANNQCIDKGASGLLYPCHPAHIKSITQAFWWTKQLEIRYVWDTCVVAYGATLRLGPCTANARGWEYDQVSQTIRFQGKCLQGENNRLTLSVCDSRPSQRFQFTGVVNA